MMIKKEPIEIKKKKMENGNETSTNTTTTPVNTTDDTSNCNINDDGSNGTVDGDDQFDNSSKTVEETVSNNNQYKNSFNQENGLSIEISADSELSVNINIRYS